MVVADGLLGSHGLAHARRMVEMLLPADLGDEVSATRRLHTAFSLLQSLPASNALRRNRALLSSLPLSDIETLDATLIEPVRATEGVNPMDSHAVHASRQPLPCISLDECHPLLTETLLRWLVVSFLLSAVWPGTSAYAASLGLPSIGRHVPQRLTRRCSRPRATTAAATRCIGWQWQ